METGWILLPDTSPTLEMFRKRPRRVPMVFPSPTSTRDGYGHINGVPVLHSLYLMVILVLVSKNLNTKHYSEPDTKQNDALNFYR
ncbi:hypothetical protein HanIR_Chr10g0500431 [Helianthus annuus]|nr:hypothetical protein HanIR_Chr10g0500431 [Helianthus annuus]